MNSTEESLSSPSTTANTDAVQNSQTGTAKAGNEQTSAGQPSTDSSSATVGRPSGGPLNLEQIRKLRESQPASKPSASKESSKGGKQAGQASSQNRGKKRNSDSSDEASPGHASQANAEGSLSHSASESHSVASSSVAGSVSESGAGPSSDVPSQSGDEKEDENAITADATRIAKGMMTATRHPPLSSSPKSNDQISVNLCPPIWNRNWNQRWQMPT